MYEPAVLHEPTGGAFDDRSALDHAEPFDPRVFGDDLDVTAERGAVFDGLGLESGIDPRLGQGGVPPAVTTVTPTTRPNGEPRCLAC